MVEEIALRKKINPFFILVLRVQISNINNMFQPQQDFMGELSRNFQSNLSEMGSNLQRQVRKVTKLKSGL